jgi:hypothetical protein
MLKSSQQMQPGFLTDMLSLVTKRYYEMSTKESLFVREEYLGVKFVETLGSLYALVDQKGGKLGKDQIIILMSATLTYSKQAFEQQAQRPTDLRSALL